MRRSLTLLMLVLCSQVWAGMPGLKVSENKRYLVYENNDAFFYLGDTAWELFHRLKREEAEHYLTQRAKLGYTVIQAVALAEENGLGAPNPYGFTPLLNNDPAKPDVKEGAENDYWDHVDWIVEKANALGVYVGLLPTWGDKWNKKWGQGPEIFTPQNAEIYGEWIGQRYKGKGIIWILGGDRPIENDTHRAIINAMAKGIRKAVGQSQLMTFHPMGGRGSAEWFHTEEWLDFNMRQNGHGTDFKAYANTRADYERTPVKPVIDAEPIYEDHPIAFKANENGHSIAADVRRPLYWNLFTGACGHTYGHHSVWQMFDTGRKPVNLPLMTWREALEQPGAKQMQYARKLLASRHIGKRVPDDSIIVAGTAESEIPGAGLKRMVATRSPDGLFALIYTPAGRKFKVKMDAIKGDKVKAWWFNPRNGEATLIGEFPNTGTQEFVPPDAGENLDWVLALDDGNYIPPGSSKD
jgi:hypothetical protein